MSGYQFINDDGVFLLEQPDNSSFLYFPIAGENTQSQTALKGAVTPKCGGDLKTDQNHFLLQPVSVMDLSNNRNGRNFWCRMEDGSCWSAVGESPAAGSARFSGKEEKCTLTGGMLWQKTERQQLNGPLWAEITMFVALTKPQVEVMQVVIRNKGEQSICFRPVGAIPLFARSADNLRDHRNVTSLLHRISLLPWGVSVMPTLSFDERGHRKNDTAYFVCGKEGSGADPESFYPVLEEYMGEGGQPDWPEAVVRDLPGYRYEEAERMADCQGYEAMGGIRFAQKCLEPGEEAVYLLFTGLVQSDGGTAQCGDAAERSIAAEQGPDSECDVTRRIRTVISSLMEQIGSRERTEAAFTQMQAHWKKQQSIFFHTGDRDFDCYMRWVNFQPVLRRIYGCSFLPCHDYGKGGRGWRDLWQDCQALLLMNPEEVRGMLVDYCAGIRMDGTNATIIGSKRGEFIADRNSITRVWSDHGLWPLITISLYIEQTGDLGILSEQNGYFKDRQIARGTAVDFLWEADQGTRQLKQDGTEYRGSMLEHLLLQNLTAYYDVGEHNHLKLRGADWNDALDMAPDRGESVAFHAAYAGNLQTLAQLLLRLKETGVKELVLPVEMEELMMAQLWKAEGTGSRGELSAEEKQEVLRRYCHKVEHTISGETFRIETGEAGNILLQKAEGIRRHIRSSEWIASDCGGWFNGYYDNHGRQVERAGSVKQAFAGTDGIKGSSAEAGVSRQARMMLTSQVFTIMMGTATEEQIREIVKAADCYLYAPEIGGYRLNTDFGEVKMDLGRMFGFAYGHKENGAVFCHMAVMYANALYKRGFAAEGNKVLEALYRQAGRFEVSRLYPGIPEYFNEKGRGMYPFLTGAASWLTMTVLNEVFGIHPSAGNLEIRPALMPEQFDEKGTAWVEFPFCGRSFKVILHLMNREQPSSTRHSGKYRIIDWYWNGVQQSAHEGCRIDQGKILLTAADSQQEVVLWLEEASNKRKG